MAFLLPLALVYYGQLIAVLEQGARAQGQIPWLELYYPRGFLPWLGLHEPPAKTPAVRPPLPGTPGTLRQLPCPPQLAGQRPAKLRRVTTGLSKLQQRCTRYLSHDRSPKPELPHKSTPRDAPLYAQGYLVERQSLQPKLPTAARRRGPLSVLLGLPPGPAPHLEYSR